MKMRTKREARASSKKRTPQKKRSTQETETEEGSSFESGASSDVRGRRSAYFGSAEVRHTSLSATVNLDRRSELFVILLSCMMVYGECMIIYGVAGVAGVTLKVGDRSVESDRDPHLS